MKRLIIIYFACISLLISSCNENSVQPEQQFIQIHFKYNFNDELNTFENYYQKDLVGDGLIKVDFWLTRDEQNKILEKVNETNYFLLPDTILNKASVEVTPNPVQFLRIKNNGKENSVVWNYIITEYQTEQYKKLLELAVYIRNIIESKNEYKVLPPRKGGYD